MREKTFHVYVDSHDRSLLLTFFVRYCNNNLNCPIDSESTSWYIDTGGIDTVRINSWR